MCSLERVSLSGHEWRLLFSPRALAQTDLGIIYRVGSVRIVVSGVNLCWTGALWSFSWICRVSQGHGKWLLSPNSFFQLNDSSCLDISFKQKFSSKYRQMKILPRCVQCKWPWRRWAEILAEIWTGWNTPGTLQSPFCLVMPDKQSVQGAA